MHDNWQAPRQHQYSKKKKRLGALLSPGHVSLMTSSAEQMLLSLFKFTDDDPKSLVLDKVAFDHARVSTLVGSVTLHYYLFQGKLNSSGTSAGVHF